LANHAETPRSDDEKYADFGAALAAAVDRSIRPWLRHTIGLRTGSSDLDATMTQAIEGAALDANDLLVALASADVDEPLSGPLERIRCAVSQLTPRLIEMGAEPVKRDPFDVQIRPDDLFALGPMAFADLGDDVQNAGITWGAAKAHLHQKRRRGPSV
jgi:hypothetical protein